MIVAIIVTSTLFVGGNVLAEFDRSIHCFFTFRFHVESATWIWRFSGACPFAIRSFKPEVGMTNKAFIIQKTMQLILLLT